MQRLRKLEVAAGYVELLREVDIIGCVEMSYATRSVAS
jgi:hypothetical protein